MITDTHRIPILAKILLALFAAYLVGRGIAEPFVIDVHDPSYHLDWGGPSLAGVLAVGRRPGFVRWPVGRQWRRRVRLSRDHD